MCCRVSRQSGGSAEPWVGGPVAMATTPHNTPLRRLATELEITEVQPEILELRAVITAMPHVEKLP